MYIATPICAPSRTETLSGRLYHNVLTDDLTGAMHVNDTGYLFEHPAAIVPALQKVSVAGLVFESFSDHFAKSSSWY